MFKAVVPTNTYISNMLSKIEHSKHWFAFVHMNLCMNIWAVSIFSILLCCSTYPNACHSKEFIHKTCLNESRRYSNGLTIYLDRIHRFI